MRRSARGRGFTIIEVMVVVAIAAVLLALAAPSFSGFLARKRIEGSMSELGTDLQYARSEAVARNAAVRVTFGTRCYLVTVQPTDGSNPASSCTQTTSSPGALTTPVKLVQLTGTAAQFTPVASLQWIEFDPVRGIAAFSTGGSSGEMKVTAGTGSPQLRAVVSAVGRFCIDSPDSSIKGYAPCS